MAMTTQQLKEAGLAAGREVFAAELAAGRVVLNQDQAYLDGLVSTYVNSDMRLKGLRADSYRTEFVNSFVRAYMHAYNELPEVAGPRKLAWFTRRVNENLEDAKQAVAEFAAKLASSPDPSWVLENDNAFAAAAKVRVLSCVKQVLESQEEGQGLEGVRRMCQREVMSVARYGTRSSSSLSNEMTRVRASEFATVLESLEGLF